MKTLILTATLTFLTIFSSAQDAENEKSMAAAEKLFATMKIQEDLTEGFQASMSVMLQPLVQQLGLNEEQVKELNTIITDWWENDIDQEKIMKDFKLLYAESYTAEELAELELFYQTPLGAKTLALTPELTQKGMEIGMLAAQEKQAILMEKMQAFEASLVPEPEPEPEPKKAEEADKEPAEKADGE